MTNNSNTVFRAGKPESNVDTKETDDRAQSLADELMQLTDDFTEYGDISAFMCNAFANALKEHDWLTGEIISGARICSGWLQQRTGELKDDIRNVHMRYAAEHGEAPPNGKKQTTAPSRDTQGHSPSDYFF